jgi:hypothetical protein
VESDRSSASELDIFYQETKHSCLTPLFDFSFSINLASLSASLIYTEIEGKSGFFSPYCVSYFVLRITEYGGAL